MKLEERYIQPTSALMNDYIHNDEKLASFFSYAPDVSALGGRMEKLAAHPADAEELAGIVRGGMERFGLSDQAARNLDALAGGAPVVIAGQQAGLLTGPLYTVHKAISVLILAKQASEQLGKDVVPVFWIAGEDHDLAEISHLYLKAGTTVEKLNIPFAQYGKQSASSVTLQKDRVRPYLEAYFRSLPETAYSKELQAQCHRFLDESESFTDFFAHFIQAFFGETGLLFIDAANPELRRFESPLFAEMITNNEAIARAVTATEERLTQLGYPPVIGAELQSANLFLDIHGERTLLQREGGEFTCNGGAIRFTREELLAIAETAPERLSNNVVTRPIMQEMVFPVLAFIGGPGEIAYWAALKDAFGVLDMEMPVVMPRLNMTIVNRRTQQLFVKYGLTFEEVMEQDKVAELRAELLDRHREKEAEERIRELRDMLNEQYGKIEASFRNVSAGLQPVVEKNLQFHAGQLDFLASKLEEEVLLQHQTELDHYRTIEQELLPLGSFQERIYTPYVYMNEYGVDFVDHLARLNFNYDKTHKVIYL